MSNEKRLIGFAAPAGAVEAAGGHCCTGIAGGDTGGAPAEVDRDRAAGARAPAIEGHDTAQSSAPRRGPRSRPGPATHPAAAVPRHQRSLPRRSRSLTSHIQEHRNTQL
jgi:hypothetical protein